MKKFFAFLLSVLMLFGTVLPSFAADEPTLLTYQSETPEAFTKNVITIDPRNQTGDNPDLKPGVHYNTPSWGEVLSLIPQSAGGTVTPDPNAGKAPEGSMIYLPEMTETMAGGDIVTIDPRDFTGNNPNLVEGTDYTMLYTGKGGWGDVLCLIPKSKDQPVTYNVKFTVEDPGKYEFSVGIWTSPDAKAGTPRKIDVFLDGGEKYRITETDAVAVNHVANFYGITATLAAGEHTFSFQTCTQNGLQCYINTLSYSMVESTDTYDPAIESTWGDTNIPEGEPVYVVTKPVIVQVTEETGTDAPDTGDTTAPDNRPNVTVIAIVIAAVVAVIAAAAVILAKKKKK